MKAIVFCVFIVSAVYLGNVQAADELKQSQSDAEIRQKIVGVWIIDIGTNSFFSAKGTVTYASNNCYVAKCKVVDNGKTNEIMYAGMWKVENGVLTDTVTNASGHFLVTDLSKDPPKNYEHARVVRVNENELVLDSGKKIKHIETSKRQK